MNRLFFIALLATLCAVPTLAQKNQGAIKVSPNGVNVNANGATTVFLTFGGMKASHRPAEATWCGELIPAAPDVGLKCDPATIYGYLPERPDLSRPSGLGGLTDIMSIPASVARRAYQDAQSGAQSAFYYVRRFINTAGGPDEYVVVTCRMAGGGVSTPLALTSVKLSFTDDQSGQPGPELLSVRAGGKLPTIQADLVYNGTGRLVGRWEVVLPGDELPNERDLLTEATLPAEERGRQRRYMTVERFNVFLPPTGRHTLTLKDTSRLPTNTEGPYQVLLRVEVSEDQDAGVNLVAAGAGSGFIQTGAVAGFALPVLRYYAGGDRATISSSLPTPAALALFSPAEAENITIGREVVFSWGDSAQAAFYRLEVKAAENGTADGGMILSAVQRKGNRTYHAPTWLKEKAGARLRWRVVALDQNGNAVGASGWRTFQFQLVQ